jgi:hypothetical protein
MLFPYQSYDRCDGPIYIDVIVAKDRDQAVTRSNRGYLHICSIVTHDLSYCIEPLGQDPVQFTRMDSDISRNNHVELTVSSQLRFASVW